MDHLGTREPEEVWARAHRGSDLGWSSREGSLSVRPESSPGEAHSTGELPATEQRNPASARLDEMGTEDDLHLMNAEDRKVPDAVEKALPRIAEAVEILRRGLGSGGRWIYVGAGTSGRIAALDAAECPPTFGVPPGRVRRSGGGRERRRHEGRGERRGRPGGGEARPRILEPPCERRRHRTGRERQHAPTSSPPSIKQPRPDAPPSA